MVNVIETDGTHYELLPSHTAHDCGNFPTPTTTNVFIVCGCGRLYMSTILNTMCKDGKYVYHWEKPSNWRIEQAIKDGALDPKFRAKKKRWWESL